MMKNEEVKDLIHINILLGQQMLNCLLNFELQHIHNDINFCVSAYKQSFH